MKRIVFLTCIIVSLFFSLDLSGQEGVTYDLKKPEKYENFQLGSEKTADKKFKIPRHFIQNTVTHYNYYFNANNKLNEVIARARAQNRDDFSKLLPFYDYSLENTARDRKELDSVISKVTAGILIHDLRNDWVDNLYILMGKAYYFRKDLDTAYIIFQFVNYAFSPKEKGGYDKPIASNANRDEGGNNFIVSTDENRNLFKRTFSLPPSRNESLVWQVRTFLASDQLTRAATLIDALTHDPKFPARLFNELEEVRAWWFYKQNMYDSAAIYLEKALGNSLDKLQQSRTEYLIAQLYGLAFKPDQSRDFFERVSAHTYDPVMDINARLNAIRASRGSGDEFIQKNIEALEKMARKDVYAPYRDLIYYTAAEMELGRKHEAAAIDFLKKSAKYSTPNNPQRNKAFLKLGELAFSHKEYPSAKRYYDSLNALDLMMLDSGRVLSDRKKSLTRIVTQLTIVSRQDSLQLIAALPEADRTLYLKKLLKAILKKQGISEDEAAGGNFSFNSNTAAAADLFGSSSANAEWYFYNSSLKSKGYTDFKTKWGNRPNVDNWFLTSLAARQKLNGNKNGLQQGTATDSTARVQVSNSVNMESLLANLPLSPEKLKKSLDSVENALFALGRIYQDELPDYDAAIGAYDSLLQKFPQTRYREETLFHLYYCYRKIGDYSNSDRVLGLLRDKYPNGKYLDRIQDPEALNAADAVSRSSATRQYEIIYNAFIEGNFPEALAEKKKADSSYGEKYWTPQLLYIESVYYVQNRQDNLAVNELNKIVMRFAGTPMAAKAKNLIEVLGRRRQIEEYLTNLKIEREKDDSVIAAADIKLPAGQAGGPGHILIPDSASLARARANAPPRPVQKADSALAAAQAIRLRQVQLGRMRSDSQQLHGWRRLVDSLGVLMASKNLNPARMGRLKQQSDSVRALMARAAADSSQLAVSLETFRAFYVNMPDRAHNVAILLSKVDPVYVNETGNAFTRYNRENYYNMQFESSHFQLNDSDRIVLVARFDSAAAAVDYADKARKLAPREIVPWLPAGKYTFLIISDQNLEVLRSSRDLNGYKRFLQTNYPGRFP